METRRVIIVDPMIDKAIDNICNAALRHEGLTMVSSVNAVKCSILEEPMDFDDENECE